MKALTFLDVCNIISELDQEETSNKNNHMKNNPHDKQRERDHIMTNAAYCKVLYAIHDYIGG